jgi:ferredoxin-nitrite reductase
LRLTVWQNLLVSDIATKDIPAVKAEIEALGLAWEASAVRAGLVACTGNAGCRFAASNTKRHAMEIVEHIDQRLQLNVPINIHLTGCPNSCAQHYIGDIGLLGAKVAVGDDMVEGYHLYVGGGFGRDRDIGRELYRSVPADQASELIERMLRAYLEHRRDDAETFREFILRHSTEQLIEYFGTFQLEGASAA